MAEAAGAAGAVVPAGALSAAPEAFRHREIPERVRHVVRAWWAWMAVSLALQWAGSWPLAIATGMVAFFQYHISAQTHPGIYSLEADLDLDSAEFQNTIEGVTGMPFVAGNHVAIYNNGDEFYPAMLKAIESAQQSVTMEQYVFWDGEVGRRFAEAFAARARQGVPVKLLLDAIGSSTLGKGDLPHPRGRGMPARLVSSYSLVHSTSR